MPVVQVWLVEGHDEATRAAVVAQLTEVTVRVLGVEPVRVRVLLYELPAANWGVGGRSKAQSR